MIHHNDERPSRPSTAARAAPIDVLSAEVEEMEIASQQQQSRPQMLFQVEAAAPPHGPDAPHPLRGQLP